MPVDSSSCSGGEWAAAVGEVGGSGGVNNYLLGRAAHHKLVCCSGSWAPQRSWAIEGMLWQARGLWQPPNAPALGTLGGGGHRALAPPRPRALALAQVWCQSPNARRRAQGAAAGGAAHGATVWCLTCCPLRPEPNRLPLLELPSRLLRLAARVQAGSQPIVGFAASDGLSAVRQAHPWCWNASAHPLAPACAPTWGQRGMGAGTRCWAMLNPAKESLPLWVAGLGAPIPPVATSLPPQQELLFTPCRRA